MRYFSLTNIERETTVRTRQLVNIVYWETETQATIGRRGCYRLHLGVLLPFERTLSTR